MGTEGGNTEGFNTLPENHPDERLPPLEEASLIDRFQNVGLRPHYGGGGGGGGVSNSSVAIAAIFPLRPYAEDCSFYLKTGTCKYGSLCRYNHPIRRAALVVQDRDWNHQEQSAKHLQSVQCKYFLSAGGCAKGSLCKFKHVGAYIATAGPTLNFVGLPKREGEKECPFFIRNGSCSYGANCVFHHPEPLSVGKDKSMKQTFTPLDCGPGLFPLSDAAPRQQAAPWLSNPLPQSPLSFQDCKAHHTIISGNYEPNPYQAPQYPYPRMPVPVHPSPGAVRSVNPQACLYGDADEFPQRPGQPECAYFMKSGNCKFKFTCRYHHPKVQYECLLNEKGLPMRPGRNVCQHYKSFGVCKYGQSCLFDHPMNHNPSNVQNWLSSKPRNEVGSWNK